MKNFSISSLLVLLLSLITVALPAQTSAQATNNTTTSVQTAPTADDATEAKPRQRRSPQRQADGGKIRERSTTDRVRRQPTERTGNRTTANQEVVRDSDRQPRTAERRTPRTQDDRRRRPTPTTDASGGDNDRNNGKAKKGKKAKKQNGWRSADHPGQGNAYGRGKAKAKKTDKPGKANW